VKRAPSGKQGRKTSINSGKVVVQYLEGDFTLVYALFKGLALVELSFGCWLLMIFRVVAGAIF
jgi:hypothetical protein